MQGVGVAGLELSRKGSRSVCTVLKGCLCCEVGWTGTAIPEYLQKGTGNIFAKSEWVTYPTANGSLFAKVRALWWKVFNLEEMQL